MNELDKLALINNECSIKTKIILDNDIVLTESDCVLSWDYEDFRYVPNQGFIGQFVERVVNGKFKNIDDSFTLENKILEIQFAVVRNDGTETWYSLGNFIVNNPTDDYVSVNTSIKAVDYTKFFETAFVNKLSYPTTAGALAYNVCRQAKTHLGNFEASLTKDTTLNTSKQYFTYDSVNDAYNLVVEPIASDLSKYYEINECFTNHDFVIDNNQFTNNETCRTVMKAIGMLAYSWVRIGWDNKCYIDFEVNKTISDENVITNDNYYDLNTKNDYFGEVNKVIIGMKDVDGENTTLIDKNSNTTENFEIALWDNPLTYTQELRQKAIAKANKLFGLKYKPVELTTTGNPWLMGNELLEIVDMEGNSIFTYPFDRTISYSGHIKTKIKSQALSKTDTKYTYEGAINVLNKNIKNTQIIVDKANQKIDAVVESNEENSKQISAINLSLEGISSTVNSTTQTVKNLEDSIDYFSVDLSQYNLTIPTDSANKPIETKQYNIPYYAHLKGTQVTPTVTIQNSNTGITAGKTDTYLSFAVTTSTSITKALNEYDILFQFTEGASTYSLTKKVTIALAKAGTNGTNGSDGKSAYQIWLEAGNSGTEADYLASLKGAPGTPGAPGKDGTSTYFYVRYSANSNGNPMVTTPSSTTKYMGVASTTSSTAPTSYSAYTWSLIKGADGTDGTPGKDGESGEFLNISRETIYQIHLVIWIDGADSDCINQALGVGSTIYINFSAEAPGRA